MSVQAQLTLKREDLPAIGRDRIRLLEEVARAGSISGGARAIGLTYKAAWDALDAMSNVVAEPLIVTRSGGNDRGGAILTEAGRRLIAGFHRFEAEMARIARTLDADLTGTGIASRDIVSGFMFRTSARNMLRGRVQAIKAGGLTSAIAVEISPQASLVAHVTNQSVTALGLHTGRDILVLIKAYFVRVTGGTEQDAAPDQNRLAGKIKRCEISGDQAEIVVDIGSGKTIAAIMPETAVKKSKLKVGLRAVATFDPQHVIIAVD